MEYLLLFLILCGILMFFYIKKYKKILILKEKKLIQEKVEPQKKIFLSEENRSKLLEKRKYYNLKKEKTLSEPKKNINENRGYSYNRPKNTFFDLPIHDENYESNFDEEDKEDFIFTKVAGVSKKNGDGVERQTILQNCYEGEALILERDIYNEVSNYAIKVCRMCNDEQIGYLNDSLAKKIKNREIERFKVVLKEITGGTIDKPTLGCNIKIIFAA
ncbi:HIRAN domain-containing protein [Aliarcobacter butzleri]|uniref:HIRAN domain-containing protein n=1 Tax=Aliarcobacter butzleri TaxID=28197 RepID=UPI00125F3674|nr:HIRAN domain-containing protein [Aliarcobacter butzleri]MCT7596407.1 HIRAN domain-containing protein [Aliarcobacter butzleri]